jgi:hypothetical protein
LSQKISVTGSKMSEKVWSVRTHQELSSYQEEEGTKRLIFLKRKIQASSTQLIILPLKKWLLINCREKINILDMTPRSSLTKQKMLV